MAKALLSRNPFVNQVVCFGGPPFDIEYKNLYVCFREHLLSHVNILKSPLFFLPSYSLMMCNSLLFFSSANLF